MLNISLAGTQLPCLARGGLFRYGKGERIYAQGDAVRHWYEVVDGLVRTCRLQANGSRQLTSFFYPNEVFGLEEGVHRETAEAVTDLILRRHDAQQPGSSGPHAEIALKKALGSARKCIFLFGRRTAEEKVAAFLLSVAERLQVRDGVLIPMSRSDIADHLGLTMHTVSRTISQLSRRGLIALKGSHSVTIQDRLGLCELAGEDPDDETQLALQEQLVLNGS